MNIKSHQPPLIPDALHLATRARAALRCFWFLGDRHSLLVPWPPWQERTHLFYV